jgi:N-acetylmuramic acid 6-phosphate etherase
MQPFDKITEAPSNYRHLEQMSLEEVLRHMNNEDKTVPQAIEQVLPQIEQLAEAALDCLLAGGRLFYIGAGTSGRLAVVDASECPPTFGVPPGLVVAIIAGGERAITQAVEGAEDDAAQGWADLEAHNVSEKDFVIGIAASGTTPYVIGALEECRKRGIATGSITNNPGSPLTHAADFPVAVAVGPEFVTGSTRLKSGTSQKLVLNMVSTAVMIGLGRVEDNRMVHMQLTNEKLVDRGTKMLMDRLQLADYDAAKALLIKWGSVKKAVEQAGH